MLTRFVKAQLALFAVLTLIALATLLVYYLRVPSLAGVGQYTLHADLPRSGGLYSSANVTYRGTTIGKVTAVEPTATGARVTMSIDSGFRIPADARADVHSVSAIGEQYLDLVATGESGQFLGDGQTVAAGTIPSEIGPSLDQAQRGFAVLPKEKIDAMLTETSQAVAGLGPALQRLVDSSTNIAQGFRDNIDPVNDIIANSAPILDSQVNSGDAIERWSRNLNALAAQAAEQDRALRSGLQQAAPTADQLNAVFSGVREPLPQTLANVAVVADMLKRYNKGLEQGLVAIPEGATMLEMGTIFPDEGLLHVSLTALGQPPSCLTGFLPASEWRSPADTSTAPLESGLYCKIPQDFQGNAVRGARNYPCADVPGKRAATPRECRSDEPYVPLGTNPWYGDPNQIRNCPAPAARCDQPVEPGLVIPAPTVNTGMNPLPADRLPPSPAPISDSLTPPGQGTVTCSGQQPNPCIYTPAPGTTAIYNPASGEVVGPDGVKYSVSNSNNPGDNGWKEMLAPAG